MDYKYMKVSHEGKKTIGMRAYSKDEADLIYKELFPSKFELLEQEETVPGSIQLTPAKLDNGYYPIEHFKAIILAAKIVPYGKAIEPSTLPPAYEYIGPAAIR